MPPAPGNPRSIASKNPFGVLSPNDNEEPSSSNILAAALVDEMEDIPEDEFSDTMDFGPDTELAPPSDAMEIQSEEPSASQPADSSVAETTSSLAELNVTAANITQWLLSPIGGSGTKRPSDDLPQSQSKRQQTESRAGPFAPASALPPPRVHAGHTMSIRAAAPRVHIPYEKIRTKHVHTPCFVQLRHLSEDAAGPVIGTLYDVKDGWSVHLGIDTGRYGEPSLTLGFKVSRSPDSGEPVTDKLPDCDLFDVTWTPGVRLDGKWMIDRMAHTRLAWQRDQPGLYNHTIVMKTLDKGDEIQATGSRSDEENLNKLYATFDRIVALTFQSGGAVIHGADRAQWDGLPDDVVSVFETLVFATSSLSVTIFFNPSASLQAAEDCWLRLFEEQVNRHISPFYEFLNEDGGPVVGFKETPPIGLVGNGMFVTGRNSKTGQPTSFYYIKPRLEWLRFEDFLICLAMPVIREYQYARAQLAHLENRVLQAFFEEIMPLTYAGQKIGAKDPINKFFIFIRIKRLERSEKIGYPPAVNTPVSLELDNSSPGGKSHQKSPRNKLWKGNVISNDQGCKKTRTSFCVAVEKPASTLGVKWPSQVKSTQKAFNLDQPERIRLYFEHEDISADRNLKGAGLFASPVWDKETLDPIRKVFMGDARAVADMPITNLARKNGGTAYEAFRVWVTKEFKVNESQMKMIETMTNAPRLIGCIGPPGSGKTTTLALVTVGLAINDNRVLFFGPSNMCVDRAANQIWEDDVKWKAYSAKKKHLKEIGRKKRYLRLEVEGAELRAMATIAKYATPKDGDAPRRLESREEEDFLAEDLQARESLAKLVMKQYELEEELSALEKTSKDDEQAAIRQKIDQGVQERVQLKKDYQHYSWAMQQLKKSASRRVAKVPIGMTSGWHLFFQCRDDEQNAMDQVKAVKEAYKTATTQDELDRGVAEGKYNVDDELYKAFKAPALTDEEVDQKFATGANKVWEQRDKSANFKRLRDLFIESKGNLPPNERKEFHKEWVYAMRRMFEKMDVIFTTSNNAGSDLLADAFKPNVLICDEAGQVGLASAAIPMTQFQGWDSIMFVGDPLQLYPFGIAGANNEFRELAKFSPLGMLKDKEYPLHWLDTQYRMHPDVAEFPANYFYEGRLRSAPSTNEDNDEREAIKLIAKNHYGIPNPAPYLIVDVMNGISTAQESGTSSENYANANSIFRFVDRLFESGVRSERITILTYYTGQKTLLRSKLRELCAAQGRTWDVDNVAIETTDSFQGQENSIILLDLVVAKPIRTDFWGVRTARLTPHTIEREDGDDNADEVVGAGARPTAIAGATSLADNSEYFDAYGSYLSSHMTDTHRLATSLTRARDGLVVFCKVDTIRAAVSHKGAGKGPRALWDMIRSAIARELIHHDSTSMDTSPKALARTASYTQAQQHETWRKNKELGIAHMNKALKQYGDAPHTPAPTRYGSRMPKGSKLNFSQKPRTQAGVDPETRRNDPRYVPYATISGSKQRKPQFFPMDIDKPASVAKGKGKQNTVFDGSEEDRVEFDRLQARIREEKEAEDLQTAIQNSRITQMQEEDKEEDDPAGAGSSSKAMEKRKEE